MLSLENRLTHWRQRDRSEGVRLERRLEGIEEGFRLRRAMDEPEARVDPGVLEAIRGELLDEMRIVLERISRMGREGRRSLEIRPLLVTVVAEDAQYLTKLAQRDDLDDRQRAERLARLRMELEWHQTLLMAIEGIRLPSPLVYIHVHLERLTRQLDQLAAPQSPGPVRGEANGLLQVRDRLDDWILVRRAELALAENPLENLDLTVASPEIPERLWARRFALSGLAASLRARRSEPGEWKSEIPWEELETALGEQRQLLAVTITHQLDLLQGSERIAALDRLILLAEEESHEIASYLEEISLPQAVETACVSHEDFRELRELCQPPIDTPPARSRKEQRRSDRRLRQLLHRSRSDLQDKRLALAMESRFGRRGAQFIEGSILVLIVLVAFLIGLEIYYELRGELTPTGEAIFAWLDLGICSCFLAEFFTKLTLSDSRWLYLRRRWLFELLPSIPFGFIAFELMLLEAHFAAQSPVLLRLVRLLRLPQLARYLQLIRPLVRFGRLFFFIVRLTDQLVRRNARLLNTNILLFEPVGREDRETKLDHDLDLLRAECERRLLDCQSRLDGANRIGLARTELLDVERRVTTLPDEPKPDPRTHDSSTRAVAIEAVIERLVEMTPERLIVDMGPRFVESLDRYIGLFDAPGIRRLPVVRELVTFRSLGAAHSAALACNYAGHFIQWLVGIAYFFADLRGTVTAPLFLDRLGTTIVNAASRPAKRLVLFGLLFVLLFLIIDHVKFLTPIHFVFHKLKTIFGWGFFALGILCGIAWGIGIWLRRIANQASDEGERIVEAQFASHTKRLKMIRREQDARFLVERVIEPEFHLRTCDDVEETDFGHINQTGHLSQAGLRPSTGDYAHLFEFDATQLDPREQMFLSHVELLYQDYLDGSIFHRSDTKASTQLVGNLALSNLRRRSRHHFLFESKRMNALDLGRASGGILGGPYLWFNYITRMISLETAKLLLDYNRNAIPLDRLACSSELTRSRYQQWLAHRLERRPDEVPLPPRHQTAWPEVESLLIHPLIDKFLENVDFTAVDFLAEDSEREAAIEAKYGPLIVELVRRDRQRNVRRAFRSFPLHRVPPSRRTINPYFLYQKHLANGWFALLPLVLVGKAIVGTVSLFRSLFQTIREILNPVLIVENHEDDHYSIAIRKIHRMRKPVFMQSLWLRGQFDVEYLGLPLPGVPSRAMLTPLIDRDLDFIGANRRDRHRAESLRDERARRLFWVERWLDEFGLTFQKLPAYLQVHFPYLANRASEVTRALATAFIVDHDDLYTLAQSFEGLRRMMEMGRTTALLTSLPDLYPEPISSAHPLWYSKRAGKRGLEALFEIGPFRDYSATERDMILRYLRVHASMVQGWTEVVLSQGGDDPLEVLRCRLQEVIVRTDLWSDELVVLRTVQTLTILDLHHYCEMVWRLGGYEGGGDDPARAAAWTELPFCNGVAPAPIAADPTTSAPVPTR